MNLVKYLIPRFFVLVFFCLAFSCKKHNDFANESAQDAVDMRVAVGETDELLKNINLLISEQFVLRGKPQAGGSTATGVCGIEFDSTRLTSGYLDINFLGVPCGNRTVQGKVSVKFDNYPLTKWKNHGAVATITLSAYKVKNNADGKTWQFDGVLSMTNQGSGTFYDIMYLNQAFVLFDIKSEKIKFTFGTGDYANVYMHRRLRYTYASGGHISCAVEGLAEVNGVQNAECWGENRNNEDFISTVSNNYRWTTVCGAMAPTEGETQLHYVTKDIILKSSYSVDQKGASVNSGCAYGYKVTWNLRNKTNTRIFSYF